VGNYRLSRFLPEIILFHTLDNNSLYFLNTYKLNHYHLSMIHSLIIIEVLSGLTNLMI